MGATGHELILPLVEEENVCLPLPINVVSKYWGVDLPMFEAAENSKRYPGFAGSILIEGIELAERHGLSCVIVRSKMDELKEIVNAEVPPIVILPGIPEITQHASVISGYDNDENTILHYVQKGTREGEPQEGAIPQDIFETEWSEDGRLLIVIAPPDALGRLGLQDRTDANANRLCLVAERLGIQGNHDMALDTLKQAVREDPENAIALQMLAALLNNAGSPDCVKFYEGSVRANPRCYLGYNGLGNYHLKAGNLDAAISYYDKAIRINPKRSARIYKNRAYLLEKQQKNFRASADLKTYLDMYPQARDRGAIEQAIRQLDAAMQK